MNTEQLKEAVMALNHATELFNKAVMETTKSTRKGKRVRNAGGVYYWLTVDGRAIESKDCQDTHDNYVWSVGNYFLTREAAESYITKLLTTQEIKDRIAELNDGWESDWSNLNQKRYLVYLSRERLGTACLHDNQLVSSDLHFKCPEIGAQLIEEFGNRLYVLFS